MERFWEFLPKWLEQYGLEWLGSFINLLFTTGLGAVLYVLTKWIYQQYKTRKAKQKATKDEKLVEQKRLEILRDLHPYFSKQQVNRSREFFIETNGQNIAPSREFEPGRTHAFASKEPLIHKFIQESFVQGKDDQRFYLVLADSGMGKTTFMINLYLRYIEESKGEAFNIKLFPLGYPDIDTQIQKLVEKGEDRNTILLLDGFDEDHEATDDYKGRMDRIIQLVKNFREVVITSRTQFFPNEHAVQGELNVPKPGTDNPGHHKFRVIYISPFDNNDINTYLNKKFPDHDELTQELKRKARIIVDKSPALMVRPMLLANIEDLLSNSEKTYSYTSDIYEILIQKWIEREAGRKPEAIREEFKRELFRFSQELARYVYQTWIKEESLLVPKEILEKFAADHHIELSKLDMESRSLLNRDAEGNCKFSHKSVLEYFLATHCKADHIFLSDFNFSGMDMVKQFCKEMGVILMTRVEGGTFQMGSDKGKSEQPIHQVTLSTFEIGTFLVTQQQWEFVMGKNPSGNQGCKNCPVEQVSWDDIQGFLQKLNALYPNMNYRLPTEAEWEFAARGGKNSKGYEYAASNNPDEVAWYGDYIGATTRPVGELKPNEIGLFDMSGHVSEWCEDWYGEYQSNPQTNPKRPRGGSKHVQRGGSFLNESPYSLRISHRSSSSPDSRDNSTGFRLARTP